MPRYRRLVTEGSVQHLISRFVNREFLFDVPHAREEYLARAARAFARVDWIPLGYALMSSHVHWIVRAGACPSDRLMRSLHGGIAGWLNRSTGRLGPVFADRYRNVECSGDTALALIAYIHNNPVRGGVVSDPCASTWTSHRAYVGLESAPAWLDVELGLELCGLDATLEGRAAFRDFVASRAGEPRRPALSAENLAEATCEARKQAALPVEIASPRLIQTDIGLSQHLEHLVPQDSPSRMASLASPQEVIEVVASVTGVAAREMRGLARGHAVCAARRCALLVWVRGLGRPATEMARALGISSGAASNHLTRSTHEERAFALRCVELVERDQEAKVVRKVKSA